MSGLLVKRFPELRSQIHHATQIMKNMGYTSANAQLLTIPPYAVGAISAYMFGVFADRSSWRMPFVVGPQLCIVIAYSILYTKAPKIQENIPACYFAVCLACFGYVLPLFAYMTSS